MLPAPQCMQMEPLITNRVRLARAKWMAHTGDRHLLRGDIPGLN